MNYICKLCGARMDPGERCDCDRIPEPEIMAACIRPVKRVTRPPEHDVPDAYIERPRREITV